MEGVKRINIARAQTCIAFLVGFRFLLPFAFLFLEAVTGAAGAGIAECDTGFAGCKLVIVNIQAVITTAIYTSKTHCTEGTKLTLTRAESLARRLRRQTCQAIHPGHIRESLRWDSPTSCTNDSRKLRRKGTDSTFGVQILLCHFSFENCTLLNINAATLQCVSRLKCFRTSPKLCESNDLLARRHPSVDTTWPGRSTRNEMREVGFIGRLP
jgi:hypothetical protein